MLNRNLYKMSSNAALNIKMLNLSIFEHRKKGRKIEKLLNFGNFWFQRHAGIPRRQFGKIMKVESCFLLTLFLI